LNSAGSGSADGFGPPASGTGAESSIAVLHSPTTASRDASTGHLRPQARPTR
jgi:hypothetical protein